MNPLIRQSVKGLVAAGALMAGPAHAYVSCSLTLTEVFTADSGTLYVFFSNGGIGQIYKTDPKYTAVLGMAMTAVTAQKNVSVRYADGTSCGQQFANIEGFGLPR